MNCLTSKPACVFASLFAVLAIPAATCWAWGGPFSCVADGHTRCMWARTWNGPNALATPLSPYFIPRTPGDCGSGGYAGGNGCQSGPPAGVTLAYGALPYPADATVGLEPMQFERLGHVPNELDIVGSVGTPPGASAPAPRR